MLSDMKHCLPVLGLLFGAAQEPAAAVRLPLFFSDHMALQREVPTQVE